MTLSLYEVKDTVCECRQDMGNYWLDGSTKGAAYHGSRRAKSVVQVECN